MLGLCWIMVDDLLWDRLEKEVPDYVSISTLDKIKEFVESGDIHPEHPGCDFVAELSCGAPFSAVHSRFVERGFSGDNYSVYEAFLGYTHGFKE